MKCNADTVARGHSATAEGSPKAVFRLNKTTEIALQCE